MHMGTHSHWWIDYSAHFKLEIFYMAKYLLCSFLYPRDRPAQV